MKSDWIGTIFTNADQRFYRLQMVGAFVLQIRSQFIAHIQMDE